MSAKRITIHDKTFELSIPESEIQAAVKNVADKIKADYAGKHPLFVVVLNGAFVFGADLFAQMEELPCQVAFSKIKSYNGTSSTGTIAEQLAITEEVSGRHVVIVEDIVETGYSMQYLLERINSYHPASVEICAFSHKPEQCKVPGLKVKYVGMKLPEAFIVGYGLDYNQSGRQLRDIYSLVQSS